MVEGTLNEVYSVISEYNRQKRRESYNIFKVLEMTDREVLMCRVLTDFLNPEGAHGKGNKYLRIFLEKIIRRADYEMVWASARVYKEYQITEERRIDIVIEATDTFIPIEVKIHAAEQKAQCYDYYMYAARKDSQPKVIYLTKWGTMPSEFSLFSADGKESLSTEKVLCISFAKDICHFMEIIISSEDDGVVREIAKQYRDAIRTFTVYVDEELQMEVADKLCENEQNFRSMIVIEQSAKKAKAKLIYEVMKEFEEQFVPLQKKYELETESKFNWYHYRAQATEEYYVQSRSTYPGLNYVFSNIALPNGIQLWFRIEVDHNLFAGICLFDTRKQGEYIINNSSDMLFQPIKEALEKRVNLAEAQHENWWVQYWYLPTAHGIANMERSKIPNFKEMNEAAIVLADKETRKCFVRENILIIERELDKILR